MPHYFTTKFTGRFLDVNVTKKVKNMYFEGFSLKMLENVGSCHRILKKKHVLREFFLSLVDCTDACDAKLVLMFAVPEVLNSEYVLF
jgi:hypothetical protein